MKIIYRYISGCVLDYWGPKAPGSCYYALLGSPFPSKSCLRVRSSMKTEPSQYPCFPYAIASCSLETSQHIVYNKKPNNKPARETDTVAAKKSLSLNLGLFGFG